MAQTLKIIFVVALCVTACLAHMCLLTPKQRGSIKGLNSPGSDDCVLIQGDCGGRPAESPVTAFRSGSNATVIFQKNLDHFDPQATSHGFFSLTLMNAGGFSKMLYSVPDSATKSLTLYTAVIDLTSIPKDEYVLQAQYVTKNSQAPAVFYQCADVAVV